MQSLRSCSLLLAETVTSPKVKRRRERQSWSSNKKTIRTWTKPGKESLLSSSISRELILNKK